MQLNLKVLDFLTVQIRYYNLLVKCSELFKRAQFNYLTENNLFIKAMLLKIFITVEKIYKRILRIQFAVRRRKIIDCGCQSFNRVGE